MELRISVAADAALSVSISGSRVELCFGTGRKVSFEGLPGDISFRFMPEEGQPEAAPVTEKVSEPVVSVREEQPVSLFDRLAGLRKQISSEVSLPPYIIFHDNTLLEMCRLLPKDMQELRAVQGVGEAKLAKYGQRFLDAIAGYAASHRDVA
jgi:superfamily II DNA helicase RecQ